MFTRICTIKNTGSIGRGVATVVGIGTMFAVAEAVETKMDEQFKKDHPGQTMKKEYVCINGSTVPFRTVDEEYSNTPRM